MCTWYFVRCVLVWSDHRWNTLNRDVKYFEFVHFHPLSEAVEYTLAVVSGWMCLKSQKRKPLFLMLKHHRMFSWNGINRQDYWNHHTFGLKGAVKTVKYAKFSYQILTTHVIQRSFVAINKNAFHCFLCIFCELFFHNIGLKKQVKTHIYLPV